MTAPERMWAPTSEPFSRTQTVISGGELLQADGGGEAGGAGADDHDVIFHGFALDVFHSSRSRLCISDRGLL